MLKMFTATIRNGALVLPDGADLGLSEEGDEVQVAVEVADAFDRAGLLFAASRPSQFERMGGGRDVSRTRGIAAPPAADRSVAGRRAGAVPVAPLRSRGEHG